MDAFSISDIITYVYFREAKKSLLMEKRGWGILTFYPFLHLLHLVICRVKQFISVGNSGSLCPHSIFKEEQVRSSSPLQHKPTWEVFYLCLPPQGPLALIWRPHFFSVFGVESRAVGREKYENICHSQIPIVFLLMALLDSGLAALSISPSADFFSSSQK